MYQINERRIHPLAEAALKQSEDLLQNVFNSIQDGFLLLDSELNIIHSNAIMERWFSDKAPLFNKKCYEVIQNRCDTCQNCRIEHTLKNRPLRTEEHKIFIKEDRVFWAEAHAYPLINEPENIIGAVVVVRKLSEKTSAEEQLPIFKKFIEASSEGLGWTDLSGNIKYINNALCHMLGEEKPEDTFGKSIRIYYPKADRNRLNREIFPHVLQHGFWNGKLDMRARNGTIISTSNSMFVLNDPEGNPIWFANVVTNITEHIRMEGALRESEERFRQLSDAGWEAIAIHDRGILLQANNQYFEMFGYDAKELLGQEIATINATLGHQEILKNNIDSDGEGGPFEVMGVKKDGTEFPIEIRIKSMEFHGETVKVAAIRDITERIKAEGHLRTERDKLQGVLNVIGEGLYIINQNFTIEYQNNILEQYFNHCIGRKCYEIYFGFIKPCKFCPAVETFQTCEVRQTEQDLSGGKSFYINSSPFTDVDGEPKAIVLLRDITEKKTLQAEAMRAGHLASLGELSAGVAHEINNPINGVINYAEILKDEFEEEGKDPDIPLRIIKEGERIAQIVANLLSFARDSQDDYAFFDIKDILNDSLNLVAKQILKDAIKLIVHMPPDLPCGIVRNQEIQQVFLNILSNSRHALNTKYPSPHKNKIIEIKGEVIDIEGKKYVRTTFHDRGTGISPDIMDKICNPFFSTKAKGEGTGLGLSISHGIIKNHGGKLWFESQENKYTNVTIDLPVEKPLEPS